MSGFSSIYLLLVLLFFSLVSLLTVANGLHLRVIHYLNVTDDDSDQEFMQDCLKWHNHYRELHGAPPLQADDKLVEVAKNFTSLILNTTTTVKSEDHLGDYGDNRYFWASAHKLRGCQQAVNRWYDGKRYWNWARPRPEGLAGNFGQLIWKETKKLGCTRRFISNELWWKTFIVCIYYPNGNINTKDEFDENTSPINKTLVVVDHEHDESIPVHTHEHERGHDHHHHNHYPDLDPHHEHYRNDHYNHNH